MATISNILPRLSNHPNQSKARRSSWKDKARWITDDGRDHYRDQDGAAQPLASVDLKADDWVIFDVPETKPPYRRIFKPGNDGLSLRPVDVSNLKSGKYPTLVNTASDGSKERIHSVTDILADISDGRYYQGDGYIVVWPPILKPSNID